MNKFVEGYYSITDKIIKFLFLLSPISFLAGNFILDLNMSLISIIFLTYIFKIDTKKYFTNYFFYIFCMISFYLIIISLISINPILSLESSFFYIRFIIFPLAFWYLLDKNEQNIKLISIIFVLAYSLVMFDAFVQYFFNQNLIGLKYNGHRLSGIFGEELILGSYLSRFFPLVCAFSIILFTKNKFYQIFFLTIIYISLDILIFLSGERLAFFYLIIISLSLLFLLNENRKIRLVTIFISIIIIFLISIFNPPVKNRMIDTTIKQTNIFGDKTVIFSSEHEAIYSVAFNIYKDHLVFGIGPKLFREYCNFEKYKKRFGCSTHPHNTYLQLLTETGIIGLFPFFLLFLLVSIKLFKQFYYVNFINKEHISNYEILLFLCVFITLWPFAPTGSFFHNWSNFIFFYPVGFILHSLYSKKKYL